MAFDTLRLQIYNAVNYRKLVSTTKPRKPVEGDSDDELVQEKINENILSSKRDAYGCVEYAPLLPKDENTNSQEEKRKNICKLLTEENIDKDELLKLIEDTYPSLRAAINQTKRDLQQIFNDWPFLKLPLNLI